MSGIEQRLRPLLVRAMAATTPAATDAARLQLAAALEREDKALQLVTEPDGLWMAHGSVGAVLGGYRTLRETFSTGKLDKSTSCGIPKPAAMLLYEAKRDIYYTVNSSSMVAAAKGLAAAKITFGKSLRVSEPVRPATPDRRAANGAVVQRSGPRGSGRLRITNGTTSDVVVAVVQGDPRKPQASIYVRSDERATLTGIRGAYSVYFKSGTDWDSGRRGFTDLCAYERFDQRFAAESSWQVSLEKTAIGNATTSSVPAF
ncbi:hypothetical protein GCM10028799_15980 [Kribbella italica]